MVSIFLSSAQKIHAFGSALRSFVPFELSPNESLKNRRGEHYCLGFFFLLENYLKANIIQFDVLFFLDCKITHSLYKIWKEKRKEEKLVCVSSYLVMS